MEVRILRTDGTGSFIEDIWKKPDHNDDQIVVKTIMTGVCRSDIDMMNGSFKKLPTHMMGHEGLGIVHNIGKNIFDVKIGDYVATRGEPAYADFYNSGKKQYIKIDYPDPKFIIEPVACGMNIYQRVKLNSRFNKNTIRVLVLGSGFMSYIINSIFLNESKYIGYQVFNIGNHNKDLFPNRIENTDGKYDIVIDITSDPKWIDLPIYEENAIIVIACEKHPSIKTDFSNLLWNNSQIILPSPRDDRFHESMILSKLLIDKNVFDKLDHFWSKGYKRNTEWKKAFNDAKNRPQGYNRGYIDWREI